MIKSLLDSGAKAVICPSNEPHETHLSTFYGSAEFTTLESRKFEIGDEEVEEEEEEAAAAATPASLASDWEDSETEKNGVEQRWPMCFWDDDDEELSHFICQFYGSLFREGARVDVALQDALASHRTLSYSCHLPTVP